MQWPEALEFKNKKDEISGAEGLLEVNHQTASLKPCKVTLYLNTFSLYESNNSFNL